MTKIGLDGKPEPEKGTPEYFKKYPWARVEEPTVKESGGDRVKYTHPAYAQIVVTRGMGGGAVLYDSEFEHNHTVNISIQTSDLERGLSQDWHYGHKPLIEFQMSEAQWATFVSSFGVGSGTCCTLRYVAPGGMGHVPRLPEIRLEKDLHNAEGKKKVDSVLKRLDALEERVRAGTKGLSKKAQDELLHDIYKARQDIGVNLDFVMSSFKEHMEETVEAAKSEVYGFINHHVQRAGLQALGSPLAEPKMIEDHSDKDDIA